MDGWSGIWGRGMGVSAGAVGRWWVVHGHPSPGPDARQMLTAAHILPPGSGTASCPAACAPASMHLP